MDTVELLQFSVGTAFDVLSQVTADLTQAQADWTPPGIANPIGALYWHTIAYTDQLVHEWCMAPFRDIPFGEWFEARCAKRELDMGQPPLRRSAGWQEKVILTPLPENPQDPYWDLRASPEGPRVNLAALHDYAGAVSQALDAWAGSVTPADLEHSIPTPIGDYRMDQFLEFFVIWHINVHCGEISALKGCQGLKGYPW